MRFGLFKYRFPTLKFDKKVCFGPSAVALDYNPIWRNDLRDEADRIISGEFTWFSIHRFNTGAMPNWFSNPFNNKEIDNPLVHWTEIGDFSSGVGDIKTVWELSRFDWLTTLARAYKVTGEIEYLDRLNLIFNNWIEENPLNQGPNWMCGQEASIRLMKILTTTSILDIEESCKEGLYELVARHVDRINANIKYGVIQDNNHGTSEAAGLYIGALWLISQNYQVDKCQKLKNKGRAVLEGRIDKLIQKDGSFSQRSCNYHRVVVDTMSFVLQMMAMHREPDFSAYIVDKLTKLGEWQYKMTFGKDGQVPNYGSNDGAMIETLHSQSYEDFRISTQLFFALLLKRRIYDMIDVSEPVYWRSDITLDQLPTYDIQKPLYEILDEHVAILRNSRASVFIKMPDDTFRPGNDTGHIDMWLDGVNILRDSGSYSYNAGVVSEEFKSVAAHNTVQFGNKEQMPKISRFLDGSWIPKSSVVGSTENKVTDIDFKYTDYNKNTHGRSVTLSEGCLIIRDTIESSSVATACFHIGETNSSIQVKIKSDGIVNNGTSKYSKFYMVYEVGPKKCIEFLSDQITTTMSW